MGSFAQKLIQETQENYNILAAHFSYTRSSIWSDLKIFTPEIKPKAKILDIGCGNGRVFGLFKNKNVDYLGIDFSKNLINEAEKRYPQAKFKIGDITVKKTWQNFKNKFDFVFCVAVLHHLPTQQLKKELTQQIWQALKPNGKAFIAVWNLWQKKYLKHHFSIKSLKLKWQLKNISALYIPYKYNQAIINRFLHRFTLKELNNLFLGANFTVEKSWSSGKNLCLEAKKQV